jgi:diaminohydroxyphosphoribosylaminopyrimidine deaminase/5-amino-6-(5-phosphoribosylamino)uracil reductase
MTPFASQDFGFHDDERLAAARDVPDESGSWALVPQMFRARQPLPAPWEERFGPLKAGAVDDLVVVGQFGQSLDGRVATETGHSHYINGPAGLAHLHRLRALVDVVVVGVGTARADDPQLTVRHVAGPSPARVVVDPRGRIAPSARLFARDGVRRLVITADGTRPELPAGVECVCLPATDGAIAPSAILAALAERGFRRMLIEGGSHTVSRFIAAGCLDRLHIVVAPIILGAGRGGVALAPVASCADALRPPMRLHRLDGEVLFDCDLSARRVPVGRANKSM